MIKDAEPLDEIWKGDLLGRRDEADTIERYLRHENNTYREQERRQSIVLGIDAPYGHGKSWFLDNLALQLAQKHPVARIDAWADDANGEPLTAFMSAIDEALSPYLSKSKKLRDRLATAKVAALPVLGKLVTGMAVKGLSKVAGDEIDRQVGDAVEQAREMLGQEEETASQPQKKGEKGDGAVADAVEKAIETVGKEIDSLVDRRGAAMLADYRQRKRSRESFRRNMAALVDAIDGADVPGQAPLIVIIDELDRCRPDYAIRVLEEIKHFFEVPGVCFVLGLHGDQLTNSIEAVYGASFDSGDYLRRFFTRRYRLKSISVHDLAAAYWRDWGLDAFPFAALRVMRRQEEHTLDPRSQIGHFLDGLRVTPREVLSIMDGVRLFGMSWREAPQIHLFALVPLLAALVRHEKLSWIDHPIASGFGIASTGKRSAGARFEIMTAQFPELAKKLGPVSQRVLDGPRDISSLNPTENFLTTVLNEEYLARAKRDGVERFSSSIIAEYPAMVERIGQFIERDTEEGQESDGASPSTD